MYEYEIHYDGHVKLHSETKLTEEDIPDLANDIIHGDVRTRFDHDAWEYNFEIIDESEE